MLHIRKSFLLTSMHLAVAGCVLVAGAGCPRKFSSNVTYTTGLTYGYGYVAAPGTEGEYELQALYFDLVAPNDQPGIQKPALVMIHGGGFTGGSRADDDLLLVADRLASEGYVCFLTDYRLLADGPPPAGDFPKYDFPSPSAVRAAIVDAKTALRFVRASADLYEVDPNRIALFGESAGAVAALAAGLSAPEEFADDGPDFPAPPENNPGVNPVPQAIIDCWGSADYFTDMFDADDPPIMIWHGTNDLTLGTFFTSALAIRQECEDYGIPYRFYPLLGEGHGAWDAEYGGKDLSTTILNFLQDFMP
ncbi:MAG TPA: alpha/beta hydrolase [Candidatus Hydrogenedentes bacterium]|nr:alpha/beta hydrolase [Candidatus Hydrogenedentota bacterium]